MKDKRIAYRLGNTIQVFRYGYTSNAKIATQQICVSLSDKAKKDHIEKGTVRSRSINKIVQSYTYSIDQFNYILDCLNNDKPTDFKTFFSLDSKNCFDCPFSANNGNGGCYTHKLMQYRGFTAMLKSIANEFDFDVNNIPVFNKDIQAEILKVCKDNYVRFGTYGEPSMHPFELVQLAAAVSKTYTGYTHQYFKKPEYAAFFMASVHNELQAKTAADKFGYRSFIAATDNNVNAIQCPASKESGFKSNCEKCGLCSGAKGKGKKDVVILKH